MYLLLLSVYLLTEYILPDWALGIADNVLNAPIAAIIGLLGVGKLLKLCAWFRTACLMPILPKIGSWVDSFVITFTQEEILCINISIGIIALVFLVAAIRHFAYAR